MRRLMFLMLAVVVSLLAVPFAAFAGTNNSGALSFPSSGKLAYVPYTTANHPTSAITIGVWVYRSDWSTAPGAMPVYANTDGGGISLYLHGTGATVNFATAADTSNYKTVVWSGANSLSSGWHQFYTRFDGRYIALFVDGSFVQQTDVGKQTTIRYTSVHIPWLLGEEPANSATPTWDGKTLNFNGYVDEFRIFNRALSNSEIAKSYNLKLIGNETGLVASYSFDEASGSTLTDASGKSGNGSLSSAVRVTSTSPDLILLTNPSPPQNLNATAEDGKTLLTWDAVTSSEVDIAGYNVYRNGVKYNTALVTSNSWTASNLINNVNYVWKVTAVDMFGHESDYSDPVSTLYDTVSPAAPIGLTAVYGNADGLVKLAWTANKETDLAGYNVYQDDAKVNEAIVPVPHYDVDGIEDNRTYVFAVTAIDVNGNESGKSLPVSYSWDTLPPVVPAGIVATGGDQRISLSWTANTESDLEGYFIYDSVGHRLNTSPLKTNSYTIIGLEVDTSYTYYLTAIDKSGNESAKSAPITAATNSDLDTEAPNTPLGVTLTNGNASAYLVWKPNSEVDLLGYNVYLDGVRVAGPLTGNSYKIGDLTNGQTYLVQVTAVDIYGNESPLSSPLTAAPSLKAIPNVKVSYDLSDVSTGISHGFSGLWLILAFAIGIPLSFFVGYRVKHLFGGA